MGKTEVLKKRVVRGRKKHPAPRLEKDVRPCARGEGANETAENSGTEENVAGEKGVGV